MKRLMQRIVASLLTSLMGSQAALAQDLTTGLVRLEDLNRLGSGSAEYVAGTEKNSVLMRVNLWGAVGKPGIHYVPIRTDLITLLSLAGGPTDRATLEEVTVRRQVKGSEKRLDIDVKKLLADSSTRSPSLEVNDVVMVPSHDPTVSDESLRNITVLASVLSIVIAGFLIRDESRR